MNKHKATIHIDNQGYEVPLAIRKLYEVLSDDDAEKHVQIRVIDESGEDYLYPITILRSIDSILNSRPDTIVALLNIKYIGAFCERN